MLIDLLSGDRDISLEAQVCIVGAGAAGVALARALNKSGRDVCLLEAGGMDYENDTQALFEGRNTGMEYYDLDHSRLRFFGGTTNIWGGRCVPMDHIDFERRDWVPHSGWPISRNDLEPWYRLAHDSLQLGEFDYGSTMWDKLGYKGVDFDSEEIATTFWRFDEMKERFNRSQCNDLVEAKKVRIVLHANLTRIQVDKDGGHIRSVQAQSLQGHKLVIHAKHYVLACGAIENARMLLNSNDIHSRGLGNEHDQVGRYFMEHPHGRIAHAESDDPTALWALYRKRQTSDGTPVAPALVASEALQRRKGILNGAATFKAQRPPEKGLAANKKVYLNLKHSINPSRSGRQVWHLYRGVRGFMQRHIPMSLVRWGAKTAKMQLYMIGRAEQAPNPQSRVVLSAQQDALGCRQADLDWQLTEIDKRSARELALAVKREFDRLGMGKVTPSSWLEDGSNIWPVDPTVGNHPIGGYHHMGTTRMSASPAHGVVDANCTVHGLGNLHIVGSSVFTTGGWANPTLTILALSRRLAQHIDRLL